MSKVKKRSCLSTLGPRYDIEESSTARHIGGRGIDYGFFSTLDAEARRRGIREVGYGIRDTWVDPAEAIPKIAPMTLGVVNTRVIELAELHEHDTHDLYALLEDAQDRLSQAVHYELQTHRKHVYAHESQIHAHQTQLQLQGTLIQTLHQVHETRSQMQQTEMAELRETDRRSQAQMVEILRVMGDIRREMGDMQAECGCAIENQVKFATCTMLGAALTWWNGQIRTLVPDAYIMTWEILKKKMTDKYCRQGEIKKLEIKLWNLKVKGNDVSTYADRLQELTLICTKFVANETERIGKYISELFDNIYGSVKASKPNTLDETIELANELMDQKLCTYRDNRAIPKGNGCFECGAPRYFKRDYPKSFMSTAFIFLINIVPTPLENSYDVELADGKIVRVDTIIRGCTLNFINHPFNIDLMPVELGSFDIIIGMDWLRSNDGRESQLTIISCSKAQEYMTKGCQIFLAQISAKKEEDKSEGKQLKDVPIVQDFPKVFLEDLPGLPPA
nr:reverse transcriptase domain-containing protein [Tanacetum cinerariifolium]